jgi:hypothetical protein
MEVSFPKRFLNFIYNLIYIFYFLMIYTWPSLEYTSRKTNSKGILIGIIVPPILGIYALILLFRKKSSPNMLITYFMPEMLDETIRDKKEENELKLMGSFFWLIMLLLPASLISDDLDFIVSSFPYHTTYQVLIPVAMLTMGYAWFYYSLKMTRNLKLSYASSIAASFIGWWFLAMAMNIGYVFAEQPRVFTRIFEDMGLY